MPHSKVFNLKLHNLPWLAFYQGIASFRNFSQEKRIRARVWSAKTSSIPYPCLHRVRRNATHVLLANPTEGYGIFIENMLDAAQGQAMPKAAWPLDLRSKKYNKLSELFARKAANKRQYHSKGGLILPYFILLFCIPLEIRPYKA